MGCRPPRHAPWLSRQVDRRVVIKACASFATMAALGLQTERWVTAQDQGSTRAATWIEADNVGSFAAASDGQVVQADFTFYAVAPHWSGDADPGGVVEASFSSDGQSWSAPVAVAAATEDAGQQDRDARRFGQLLFVNGGARYLKYRALDAGGNPIALPGLAFTYIDATTGPSIADVYRAALEPSVQQPPIIPRGGWGADERYRHLDQDPAKPLVWPPEYQAMEHVIIHHTATPNFQDPLVAIRSIYYYHAITRGWGDIGYNYLVDFMGNVYEGRSGGENVVAGHAYQYSRGSSGIATMGTFFSVATPPEARAGLVWITAWVGRALDPLGSKNFYEQAALPTICGHRDVLTTDCPGDRVYADLADVRTIVASVLAGQTQPEPHPALVAGDVLRVTVDGANLRAGPGLDFDVLREMPLDTRLTVADGPTTNDGYTWYKVSGDIGSGWCTTRGVERGDIPPPPPDFQVGDTVAVATDRLNLRSGAGLAFDAITILTNGETGMILAGPMYEDGYGWYELDAPHGTGWAAGSFLAKSDAGPPPVPVAYQVGSAVKVDTDALRLRSGAGTSTAVLASMPFGTQLTVTEHAVAADGDTWYGVTSTTYGIGWCAGQFLAPVASTADAGASLDGGARVRVVDGSLNLRSGAGVGQSVVAVMADGTVLTVADGPRAADGFDWYQVANDAYGTGWCVRDFLAAS